MPAGKKTVLILFTEGETDREFFSFYVSCLRTKYKNILLTPIELHNAKSISRYEAKVPSIFKNQISPKYSGYETIAFCSYDLDIFEFAQRPPVNWNLVREKLTEYGCNRVILIPAKKMIEDWFLKDMAGLCKFLKIPVPKKLDGKTGVEKISKLFRKGNKVYQKGSYCHKFLPYLDFEKIRKAIKNEMLEFEKHLGIPSEKKQ